MNFTNLKSKLKNVNLQNIKDFTINKKDSEGTNPSGPDKQHTDPESHQTQNSNENRVQSSNPDRVDTGEEVKTPKQQTPKKQLVTFSIATMDQFSHQELQQVIIKYDAEFKRTKKALLELQVQQKELEANFSQIKEENQKYKEEAVCYIENIDGLKEHVQRLMEQMEVQQKRIKELEKEKAQLKEQQSEQKPQTLTPQNQEKLQTDEDIHKDMIISELQQHISSLKTEIENSKKEKVQLLENQNSAKRESESTPRSQDLEKVYQKKIQDYEKQMDELREKLRKQEDYNSLMQKEVTDKEEDRQELRMKLQEKILTLSDYEKQFREIQDEAVKKQEIVLKKEKLCEQYQKRMADILNEKDGYLERIDELEQEIKATQMRMCDLNLENDKNNSDFNEKLRHRDQYVDKLNEDVKHQKSIIKSQETTISYFRKKVEELTKQLQDEKMERVNLQSEIKRIEHLSSRHSSPRDHYDEEEMGQNQNIQSQENQFIENVNFEVGEKKEAGTPRSLAQKLESQIPRHDSDRKIIRAKTHKKQMSSNQQKGKQVDTSQLQESVAQNQEELRKLREEYDTIAYDYNEIKKEKLQLEETLETERSELVEYKDKVEKMEETLFQKEKTITDLERRRQLVKKEIKVLNYRLEKEKQKNEQTQQQLMELQMQTPKSQHFDVSQRSMTDESPSNRTVGVSGYTGKEKLKKLKHELEQLYKDQLKVIFADTIDNEKAIQLERKTNFLIMSVNDIIDEIEIREKVQMEKQEKEKQNSSQRQIEGGGGILKKFARAMSNDMRSPVTNQQPIKQGGGQQAVGNYIGAFNPNQIMKQGNQPQQTNAPIVPVYKPPIQSQGTPKGSSGPIRGQHK